MSTSGGFNEYIGGCSVHQGISWWMWGIPWVHQGDINCKNPFHFYWKPRCTEYPPHPLMYSWYLPNVLMISLWCTHGIPPHALWYPPDVLNIPWCTHDIPPMYSWYPSDVLNIPDVLMVSPPMYWTPPCTHDISPMYLWYSPDVLNTPQCTEHPPMYYWTHIIQGVYL